MLYTADFTTRFKKDYKQCLKRGLAEQEIKNVMTSILNGELLAAKHKDHFLKGNFVNCRECHIRPDWLLIYRLDLSAKLVVFIRAGTHSDLFD